MCGRYYINEETWARVREDFPEVDFAGYGVAECSGAGAADRLTNPGDITPGMSALSLAGVGADKNAERVTDGGSASGDPADAPGGVLRAAPLIWGFHGFDGKSLIINARAEGIADKPTFAESVKYRRCVLPAAGFYEWDRAKEKVTFTAPGQPVIYLAGIYRSYGSEQRFAIITREANASMLPVHDRMPLMIEPADVRAWINDPSATSEFLARQLPQLDAKRDYEQLTLF